MKMLTNNTVFFIFSIFNLRETLIGGNINITTPLLVEK